MSEPTGYTETLRKQTGLRLLVLFFSFFIMLILVGAMTGLIKNIDGVGQREAVLLGSGLQCVLAFCLPAWLASRFASNRPWQYLGMTKRCTPQAVVGVIIVFIISMPAMNQLIEWNENIHLPAWGSEIEKTLREWEEMNSGVAATALGAKTFIQMLAGTAVIGIMTGIGEEMFFRGAMQHIFEDSGVKRWMAVWGAAVIFSTLHFQFFGFVPRVLMGVFFGYLLVWTGSLWPCILAHALNNSTVVVAAWLYGDPSKAEIIPTAAGAIPWGAIVSGFLTIMFFWKFREVFFKQQS